MELHAISTWYDKKAGVVRMDDDVQGVIRRIKEVNPRLHVYFNEQADRKGLPPFDVVEHCLDGEERLVFSERELTMKTVDRLLRADQWRGREDPEHMLGEDEDFLTQVDSFNDKQEQENRERDRDRVREVGERLAWALEEDGRGVHASILVKKDLDG